MFGKKNGAIHPGLSDRVQLQPGNSIVVKLDKITSEGAYMDIEFPISYDFMYSVITALRHKRIEVKDNGVTGTGAMCHVTLGPFQEPHEVTDLIKAFQEELYLSSKKDSEVRDKFTALEGRYPSPMSEGEYVLKVA